MHSKRNMGDRDKLKIPATFLQSYGMQKRKPKKSVEDKDKRQLRT